MNLHKPLDLLRQSKIPAFLKQYTPSPKHAALENKLYDSRKKSRVFGSHVDAWENVENAVLFWRKMAIIYYRLSLNTITYHLRAAPLDEGQARLQHYPFTKGFLL